MKCQRLYEKLIVKSGKRQFVLSGKTADQFFADEVCGVCADIETALLYYAVQQGYDIAVAIDEKMTLRFATPQMEAQYTDIIEQKSVDHQKKAGSVKRGQRAAPTPPPVPSQGHASNDSAPPVLDTNNTEQAVNQIQTNSQSKAQQIFDGIKNRLLPHPTKSFVILSSAEKVLEVGQNGLTPASEQKLKTIREWAKTNTGHPESATILIVDDARKEEFDLCSDRHITGLEDRCIYICIGSPDQAEIESLLVRLQCRYGFGGNTSRIARRLLAETKANDNGLYNILETIKIRRNNPPQSLDEIFEDSSVGKRADTLKEAHRQLDKMVGLNNVKEKIKGLFGLAEMIKKRQESGMDCSAFSLHSLFIGNPGTGKTVVARILAKFFFALGLSRNDKVVEISVADITSEYNPGDASVKLRDKISEAMGGVLFIDEMYQFADNQWLKEAFENVLMKTMEDHRDELTVIAAGYGGESLQRFLNINPGVKRRFKHPDNTVEFPDYNADDLLQIAERMLRSEHCHLANEAREPLRLYIEGRIKVGKMENAGGARNVIETMIQNAAKRGEFSNIGASDIPSVNRGSSIDDILDELNHQFIGLQSVKDRILRIAKRIAYEEKNGTATDRKYNMQFVGNPGTGKTTIARYMSRVFNAVGLLEGTDVIEIAGTALKGSYLGQSKDAVIKAFTQSREEGKVLFIDEAHNLYTSPHDQDSYAKEVIAQLVQEVTATKNARVFTILAGYPEPMSRLMDADAGLSRRFPLMVEFPDYTTDECLQILRNKLAKRRFVISPELEPALIARIDELKQDAKFGNAGSMEVLAEALIDNHIMRDDNSLTITFEDLS